MLFANVLVSSALEKAMLYCALQVADDRWVIVNKNHLYMIPIRKSFLFQSLREFIQ